MKILFKILPHLIIKYLINLRDKNNSNNIDPFFFQCTKQDAELNVLRLENASLTEELKLMKGNVERCQEEQRRLRKDCDQALNFINDGIPELW